MIIPSGALFDRFGSFRIAAGVEAQPVFGIVDKSGAVSDLTGRSIVWRFLDVHNVVVGTAIAATVNGATATFAFTGALTESLRIGGVAGFEIAMLTATGRVVLHRGAASIDDAAPFLGGVAGAPGTDSLTILAATGTLIISAQGAPGSSTEALAAAALANGAAAAAQNRTTFADAAGRAANAAAVDSVAKTALAVTATGDANTATAAAKAATADSVAKTALTVTATGAANAGATAANTAAAQIVPEGGPSLLIKPGTGTFPAIDDAYFVGAKSLYTRFDGVRRTLVNFADITDFSRAGNATYYDKTGALQTAPAGAVRLNYRYVGGNWVPGGLLSEAVGTNQLLQSQNLSAANWSKNDVTTPTPTSFVESTNNIGHYLGQSVSSVASGTIVCLSAIVSELGVGAKRYFALLVTGNVATPTGAVFDLASGTVTLSAGIAARAAGIVPVGPGQWLCWMSYTSDQIGVIGSQFRIQPVSNSLATSYAGDGVSGFNMSECQIELAAPSPSSRIRTTTATATRIADTMTKAVAAEFNTAAQTALLSFVVPQGASGLVDDLVLWAWNDPSSGYGYRVFYRVSVKRVFAFMSLNGIGNAVQSAPLSAGDVCKIAFGFSGKTIRMVVNGVSSGDGVNPFAGAFVPFTQRRIGTFNTNGQANTMVMPYLPHPTNPLLDASEFPRLLTVAEMQVYTA